MSACLSWRNLIDSVRQLELRWTGDSTADAQHPDYGGFVLGVHVDVGRASSYVIFYFYTLVKYRPRPKQRLPLALMFNHARVEASRHDESVIWRLAAFLQEFKFVFLSLLRKHKHRGLRQIAELCRFA